MSIIELIEAGNMDARMAALFWVAWSAARR